jgi:hypothetical protein
MEDASASYVGARSPELDVGLGSSEPWPPIQGTPRPKQGGAEMDDVYGPVLLACATDAFNAPPFGLHRRYLFGSLDGSP